MSSITAVPLKPVKRRVLVYLWAGLAVAAIAAIVLAFLAPIDSPVGFLAHNARRKGVMTTRSGLQYLVLDAGKGGPTPTDADVTLVQYEGKLLDGSTFDKSQQPTPMRPTEVVPGFGEALRLMPKGSKYRFWLKPALGYGAPRPAGAPPLTGVPADLARKVLVFDVEMLDFIPETVLRQLQAQQMMQQQRGALPGGAPGGMGAPGGEVVPGGGGVPLPARQ